MTSTALALRDEQKHLLSSVRTDDTFREQIEAALPATVTPARFLRIAATAIINDPTIASLEPHSVLQALIKCASWGLMPDGKQAAITPRKGKAVPIPMIDGYRIKLAEHGWTLRTAVVYANDEFDHRVVDGEETITHRPVRPGMERGDLIAAYAIAKHRDGRKLMTVLHPDDIAKRRASASTLNVWNNHPAAMWEKSAGRDLYDQVGLPELDERFEDRLLAARDLEPGEAAARLYPVIEHSSGVSPSRTSSPADRRGPEEDHQQAAPPAETAASRVDGAAPGEADEAEFVDPDDIEFGEQAATVDPAVQEAADQAASFVIPKGRLEGKSLQQAFDAGELEWFKGALSKVTTPGYREAVHAFARVHMPDEYARIVEGQS